MFDTYYAPVVFYINIYRQECLFGYMGEEDTRPTMSNWKKLKAVVERRTTVKRG